jgi:hypothetical protein
MLTTKDILAGRLPLPPNDYLYSNATISTADERATKARMSVSSWNPNYRDEESSWAELGKSTQHQQQQPHISTLAKTNNQLSSASHSHSTLSQLQHDRVLRERAHLRKQHVHLQAQNESLRLELRRARGALQRRAAQSDQHVRWLEAENASLQDAIAAMQRGFIDVERRIAVDEDGMNEVGAGERKKSLTARPHQEQREWYQGAGNDVVAGEQVGECCCKSECAQKEDQLQAAMRKIQDLHNQLLLERRENHLLLVNEEVEDEECKVESGDEQQICERNITRGDNACSSFCSPTKRRDAELTSALLKWGGVVGWTRREVNFRVPTESTLHQALQKVHEGLLELACDLDANVNGLGVQLEELDTFAAVCAGPDHEDRRSEEDTSSCDLLLLGFGGSGSTSGVQRGRCDSTLSSSAWSAFEL